MNQREPVLCYVDEPWAYFTTQELSAQWGDDWNDAPYEHNAEPPNEYGPHNKERGDEPWEIIKVAYDGPFSTPCSNHANSPWSVEMINAGAVAWLVTDRYCSIKKPIAIPAGTTLAKFAELVALAGGAVYMKS